MRASRVIPLLVLVVCGACGACVRSGPSRSPDQGSFRVTGVGAGVDPTIHAARLLPETVDETQGYGTEASGGLRAITAGLRVVTTREGAIVAAEDRLPQAPQLTVALPERLGGGFLYVLGTTVWRADHWLDAARPIFASLQGIQAIVPGLDRVYVRAQNAYLAIDGKTGQVLDLGPWPASPFVSGYAAADGWRAAAVTDLRGVVATFDAGATWRALDLPMDPRQVLAAGDSLAVGGIENGRTEAWFEVRGDGTVARLAGPPREARGKLLPATPPRPYYPGGYPSGYPGAVPVPVPSPAPSAPAPRASVDARDEVAVDVGARTFGRRPLAAAIEDGWPLTDGTAVVARDGALGRVRLSDGALTEVAQGAFPLKPSRCHPVSLTRPTAVGAFGFVCGEPRGTTVVYAYDPLRGRLSPLKRFDRPRIVTSSGNGAIAVRGPCAEDGDPSATPRAPLRVDSKPDGGLADGKADAGNGVKEDGEDTAVRGTAEPEPVLVAATPAAADVHPYCVLGHDNTWREIHIRGDTAGERVIVLADGKIVVVSPPQGQSAPARVTLLDRGKATTLAVVFPKVTADIARVLRLGVWLDGFEERRPGVVGGWLEAGGAMLGIEIALDGKATAGQFVRDAGMPFVSGRYGLGWTPSRRGFETTDGGMTWTSLELPEPLVPAGKVERRACGPIGCVAAGWLRVGWGETKKVATPATPAPYRTTVSASPPQLALTCETTMPVMPVPAPPHPRVPSPSAPPLRTLTGPGAFGGSPPVLGGLGIGGVTEMPPFFSQSGPTLRDADRGMPIEVTELPERYPRIGSLARIYAWGPKTGDWDTQGKWQVKWLSPFAGWTEARSTLPVLPPQTILELSRSGSPYAFGAYYGGGGGLYQVATGDDSAHALLLARRPARAEVTPVELEADRAPLEIRRADGEPFLEIDAVARAAGRWFIATPPPPGGGSPVTTLWQVDGSVARELVRVSRAALETGRPTGTRLARRSDGRAIGLVVDGQPTAERNTPTRWVLPIDLETAQLGEPEPLGYADLAGRSLEACTDDVVGWSFDTSLPGTARIKLPQGAGSMHSLYARVRLTTTRACIERIAGTYDGQTPERAAQLTRAGAHGGSGSAMKSGELIASAFAAQARYGLRCMLAK